MTSARSSSLTSVIAGLALLALGACGGTPTAPGAPPGAPIGGPEGPGAGPGPKACTQEAKICPDGSAVSRTGANCEFSPCPGEVSAPVP
jgi:hypothetical protein